MDSRDAERLLEDVEVVPMLQVPIQEAKEILEACLAADIPAVLGKDDHCVKGCAPKLLVLARAEDSPRIVELLRRRFGSLLSREGTLEGPSDGPRPRAEVGEDAMPCPACGAAIPDASPECPDCGLAV